MSAALHEGEISVLKQRERWRPGRHKWQAEVQCLTWWNASVSHNESEYSVLTPAVRICGVRADWQREKINVRLPFFDARKATFPLLKFPITFQTHNEIVFEFIPALSICQRYVKFSWSEVEKNTRWTLHMRKEHYIYVSLMQRPSCTLFILLLKPTLKVFCCKSKYQASIIHYLIYVFSSYFFSLSLLVVRII